MARRRKRRYYYNSTRRSRLRDNARYEPIGLDLAPETKRGIAIILFIVASILSGMAILNLAGPFGNTITGALRSIFGKLAYVTPIIFMGVALSLFLGVKFASSGKDEDETYLIQTSMFRTYLGAFLFILSVGGILHVRALQINSGETAFSIAQSGLGGGYVGSLTSSLLYSVMGYGASLAVLIALVLISILITFDMSIHGIFLSISRFFSSDEKKGRQNRPEDSLAAKIIRPSLADNVKINMMEAGVLAKPSRRDADRADAASGGVSVISEGILGAVVSSQKERQQALLDHMPKRFIKGEWKLPPSDLLEATTSNVKSGNIEAQVKIIKKTFADFGILVEMGEVNVGPTVTQYTFRPAVGVKLAQVLSLENDLALALAASSIRIEAPIPGKSLVGVEVPNPTSATVRLRDLVESNGFRKGESSLNFVLGRDVAGHPMFADLERMPHLLIAGASGMGKSVCLNVILTSLLYQNSPQELQMIVIDPKRVDLTLYSGIPHLLTPVVTEHKKAINALRWVVGEMDRRYQLLSETGRRNIQEYNQSEEGSMPFIAIVVDELAQLMSLAKNDVETAIVRLAQMARAVGIHLVLATQRPSVDVITGLIKANITTRIAFGVASQIDSRTILDMAGAESLLGRGDMLYQTPDLPKPKRVQAPFVSAAELSRVLSFIKEQSGPVEYQEDILEKPASGALPAGMGGEDEADSDVINAAIEEITRSRKASASLLQRRLSIGYAKAARILDILEERGLIGPSNGAKARDIYIDPPPQE